MSEAHFTRRDTTNGAEFHITPAPAPNFGGILFWSYLMFAVIWVAILLVVLQMGLAAGAGAEINVALGASIANLIMAALLSAILWVPLLFGILKMRAERKRDRKIRRPAALVVNNAGITVDGTRHFAAADIVELLVRIPGGQDGKNSPDIEWDSARLANAYNKGQKIREERIRRTQALMVRLKSDSRPQVLVVGLTPEPAEALRKDVLSAMRP